MSLNAGRDTLTFVFYCRLAVMALRRCERRVVDVAGVSFFVSLAAVLAAWRE
ncbi:hypothetical protein [Oligosphaera ethanolica]|uniref:Uncharacterized protein n=1 Tax=Oligosphaera ethanolica TaxID=760260 RepID=A0AAE4AQ18_9BACT|nr:hypothetical protein [Oligosphaera ethanolica]MDQ0289992.1 hypothetical protein [Oligosphaera ethanolica]